MNPCRSHQRPRARAAGVRDDGGFGLIEAILALFLLAMVLVPVTRLSLSVSAASNNMHLRLEASDLASARLAEVAYDAEQGGQWGDGISSEVESSGNDQFNVSLDVEPEDASELCRTGGEPQAWSAQATVSWGSGTPSADVAAGDFIAQATIVPALHSTAAGNGGEIAIPVQLTSGGLETSQPITVTIAGTCTGSSCPSGPLPAGPPFATETVNTGTSGCALFTDLYAGLGWSYTATVTDSNGYVDPSERSAPALLGASPPTLDSLTATEGTVSVPPGDAGFELAPADAVDVTFKMTGFVGSTAAPSGSPAVLPISVTSTSPGLDCGPDACTLGDGSTSFDGQQAALLFPVSSGTGTNYEGWAGGWWADPSPAVYCPNSAPQNCAAQPTLFNSALLSVSFPVYPVALEVTGLSTPATLTATPVADPSTEIALAQAVPAPGSNAATSTTGLPLGEYEVTSQPALATPEYLWVTPSGICASTSALASPCASPSTATITLATT